MLIQVTDLTCGSKRPIQVRPTHSAHCTFLGELTRLSTISYLSANHRACYQHIQTSIKSSLVSSVPLRLVFSSSSSVLMGSTGGGLSSNPEVSSVLHCKLFGQK